MIVSYLKLAIRLLMRNPFFSFINIVGLSMGFAAFLVLWQYTSNELESDQFHQRFENKARVAFTWKSKDELGTGESDIGLFSPEFAPILTTEYDDFKTYTRVYHQTHFTLGAIGDHGKEIFLSRPNADQPISFKENNLVYADPNLFEFFSFSLIEGSADKVLKEPGSIVLSESMATKYFGTATATNGILLLNDSIALKVRGVFKDLPHNTHLRFDAVISAERIRRQFNKFKEGEGVATYLEVKSNSNRNALNQKVDAAAKKYLAPGMAKLNLEPVDFEFYLQPLKEISFAKLKGDVHRHRSRTILIVLQIVSVIILITAWINYLNLVIYANSKRMKELGVRKTSGARNVDFVLQFIVESLVVNTLSILAAITLIQIARAPLQQIFQVYLTSGSGISLTAILVVVAVTLSGIIITGIYPALAVMRRSARNILTDGNQHDFFVGKGLTIFQFSVAIVLVISVFAIYSQLRFVLNRDWGMRRDEVLVFDLPENPAAYSMSVLETFLSQVSTMSGITDFALCSSVPGDNKPNGICLQRTERTPFVGTDTNGGVDERFLPFFHIKLLAGRNFVNGDQANQRSIIVSRNVLHRLGLGEPESAVGQTVLVEATEWTHNMKPAQIIGVVEDYVRKPLLAGNAMGWSNEDGVVLTYHDNVDAENKPQKISMTINPETFPETLKQLDNLYHQTFQKSFFNWYFLNDNLNQHYKEEKIIRNQILLFALLAIGIACLGLLGMVANKVEEKTKEIGIRKVLGARTHQIAQILLNTTIRQIVVAALVGIPLAHIIIKGYLEKYSERIEVQWWHYTLPVVALLVILFVTVASTLRKAAKRNPVESLRSE